MDLLLTNWLFQSTYIDDIVTGADTDGKVFELYFKAKEVFKSGGFNLKEFVTNSMELQQSIDLAESIPEDYTTAQ